MPRPAPVARPVPEEANPEMVRVEMLARKVRLDLARPSGLDLLQVDLRVPAHPFLPGVDVQAPTFTQVAPAASTVTFHPPGSYPNARLERTERARAWPVWTSLTFTPFVRSTVSPSATWSTRRSLSLVRIRVQPPVTTYGPTEVTSWSGLPEARVLLPIPITRSGHLQCREERATNAHSGRRRTHHKTRQTLRLALCL